MVAPCQVFTRRQQFDEWIERRAVDYIQPDVTKCGGLSEEYKIAMHACVSQQLPSHDSEALAS